MTTPILPDTTNFIGVALVINRSRDGPRFVFHYPPHILPQVSKGGEDLEGLDQDELLLDGITQSSAGSRAGLLSDGIDYRLWDHDGHRETDGGSQIVPWEHVAGFPTKDLESLLTPARAYHKKLFQVSLDELYFASYPIWVPEHGTWRKKKSKKQGSKGQPSKPGDDPEPSSRKGDVLSLATDVSEVEIRDATDDFITMRTPPDETEEKKSGMTMFNLVFILHPEKHEAKELVETLYFHIIRKINKAYKYSQQQSDFVWKESKKILALKDKGREERTKLSVLWKEILDRSSLAASMHDIYEAVSQNKIAALQLDTPDGTVTHSVQIPVPFFLTDIPPGDEAGTRGLWITTANNLAGEDVLEDLVFLDKNFALLLAADEKKIIAELQADVDETTEAMVQFVHLSKPTMSLHQIGQGNALSPSQVRKYAQHFIFWRRAIAIPPLHGRDTYIMSPNSNVSNLPKATQAWAKAFPLAPPLPTFLAELSTAPRPYKWFSPSKAHRPVYLQMLAWLMRDGWVTQLCTFAYVVVWPEILYEVEYEQEADELRIASEAAEAATAGSGSSPVETSSSTETASSSSPEVQHPTTLGQQVAERARLERIADKASREAAERAAAHNRKQDPEATLHPSVNDAPHLAKYSPYIIRDAGRATGRDSQYLSAIGRRFEDAKVRETWPRFWKYFNGNSALERVALQEDMKRKETWNLLTAMSEYLICVRHW